MRQIVLDTETTGLSVKDGDRIIELACIELENRNPTGREFHHFVNPNRKISKEALAVHGISEEFVSDKPPFAEIATEFLNFIQGAELIIHNAEFDLEFLDKEIELAGINAKPIDQLCPILDTLVLARERRARGNSLDVLAGEFQVDLSRRERHGALVDAKILLEVYKAMTGGQSDMLFGEEKAGDEPSELERRDDIDLPVIYANEEELALHEQWLEWLDEQSEHGAVWRQIESPEAKEAGEGLLTGVSAE